jgi:hypothetical protein
MKSLFAKDHVRDVERKFPSMRLIHNLKWLIIWEGNLRSFSATYRVRIFWHRWWSQTDWRLSTRQPRIYLIEPELKDRQQQRVPHVYPGPFRRRLCVYDPDSDEDWKKSESIAETIIPYTIQWLCTYELWHLTGEWHAPNRHPERSTSWLTRSNAQNAPPVRQERSMAGASARVGRVIGTFASSALMGRHPGDLTTRYHGGIGKKSPFRPINSLML